MKLKKDVVLAEVAGESVAVPVGEAAKSFHGVIRLNETARDVWQGLLDGKSREAIAADLLASYDVDEPRALAAVDAVMAKVTEAGLWEEEA